MSFKLICLETSTINNQENDRYRTYRELYTDKYIQHHRSMGKMKTKNCCM